MRAGRSGGAAQSVGRRQAVVELGANLGLALGHGLAALGERRSDQPAEVGARPLHLPAQVGRGHLLTLLLGPPGREHGRRGAGAEAEGQPEDPSHSLGPRSRLMARWAPAVNAANLMSGLLMVFSTTVVRRAAEPAIRPADTTRVSTCSSSRFTEVTVVRTSDSSGTVSSRMPSIRVLVLSITRNVMNSTITRNTTRNSQPTAKPMSAMSPPTEASTRNPRGQDSPRIIPMHPAPVFPDRPASALPPGRRPPVARPPRPRRTARSTGRPRTVPAGTPAP